MEQYDIIIALHIHGNAAAAITQKMNNHTAAAIMAKACTVAGVAEVADGYPDLALFVGAKARGVALLSSRLLVLDPGVRVRDFSRRAWRLPRKTRPRCSSPRVASLRQPVSHARAVSVERGGMGKRGCARRLIGWVGV